ncbi:type II toxin-antitoxin system RelE/ParE family toxin [Patescibacteria group bacterium]
MSAKFRVLTTPSFDRESKKLFKKNKKVADVFEKIVEILRNNPKNESRKYSIRKLTDVKHGEGQWRIRSGNYRFRYDISGKNVVLHSIRDRKDSYR